MRPLVFLGAVLTVVLAPTIAVATSEQQAFFDLTINLVPKGEVVVILRSEDVLIRVTDLETAGVTPPPGKRETIEGESYISLASLSPQLTYELDEKALSLKITAASNLLGSTIRNASSRKPANILYTKDASLFFNYSISALNLQENTRSFSGTGEANLSLGNNRIWTNFSVNSQGKFLRGLSQFTHQNPQTLNQWTIGDINAQTGNLGGGATLGGISFGRNFSLDPYLSTAQPFNLQGAVNSPSTVEFYANNSLVRREELPPGQFELRNLIIPAGSSTTRLVIRDAFNREQVITRPFYYSPNLLQTGLSDYSLNLGFRRDNFSKNFSYSDPLFLGRYRQGLTDALTAGVRLEAAANLISGGGEITLNTGFGTWELGLAGSQGEGFTGYAGFLGYSYTSPKLSFGATVRVLSPHYATSSLTPKADRSLLETRVQIGIPLGSLGSLTAGYALSNSRDQGLSDRLSLSSSIRLSSKMNLFANVSRTHQPEQETENSLFVGLSYIFGNRTTGNLSYQQRNDQRTMAADLQNSLALENGLGYRLRTQFQDDIQSTNVQLQYQTNFGRYDLNYSKTDSQISTLINLTGGVGYIGGTPFLSRPINNSYALVRVPGIPNVRVYLNNNQVGRTNAQGNLIVTNVLPYYGNRLSVNTADISLDYTIVDSIRYVAPPVGAGAIVEFQVVKLQAFTGTISLEIGGKTIIPVYGQLTVRREGKEVQSPLGEQGQFYLENLLPGEYTAEVQYQEQVCRFDLKIPTTPDQFLDLGNLRCIVQ